jgi:hypothetical protein
MKNRKTEPIDFEHLVERARLFLVYLDSNDIKTIFPFREECWKDLNDIIKKGSKRRIQIYNNIIDNVLIGENSLPIEHRYKIFEFFHAKLGEELNALIQKKLNLFKLIISKGIIDSRLMINDAITIQNSQILGLSVDDKKELNKIIDLSIQKRIDNLNAR